MPEACKHNIKIGQYVRRAIKAGVAMKVILDDIQKYDGAPSSMNTLYKVYREDIAAARAELGVAVGEKIMEKGLVDGDMKALELIARSKLGWSPTATVEVKDEDGEDESTSAIDDLIALLNIKKAKKDNEE